MFNPRPGQAQVLRYPGGSMGVSAVPGSGKTHTLAHLAAQLIAEGSIQDNQEVLVVTLVNSAVNNFSQKIRKFLEERRLLGSYGYRVRTLHGLAHDIVRERPGLVGLADDFQIVDEGASSQILHKVVNAWIQENRSTFDLMVLDDLSPASRAQVWRKDWPKLIADLATSFIRKAKNLQATPAMIRTRVDDSHADLPLVEIGLGIYREYQQALRYRGAVDFDDLIRLSLQALTLDDAYLRRLQARWPFILEDEAQDSNLLQEQILRLLAGEHGNWVRVGDTNQAIYETFSTADPEFLRAFIRTADHRPSLQNSGRSTRSIISLANHLVEWAKNDHPAADLRDAFTGTYISPVDPGDSQPNPCDDPSRVILSREKHTGAGEIRAVVQSLRPWIQQHPQSTAAILTTTNYRGSEVVAELERSNVPFVEILKTTREARQAAAVLRDIFKYLARPEESHRLDIVFRSWCAAVAAIQPLEANPAEALTLLHGFGPIENFVWPDENQRALQIEQYQRIDPEVVALLEQFRGVMRRWQQATLLPAGQLVLTIAQDIHFQPQDLALDYKLAVLLDGAASQHSDWRLPDLAVELDRVVQNDYKLVGFSEDDLGFNPDLHKGKVVVATVHKAKGLEWDRVDLTSVNNYDFPSLQETDIYQSEKWYLKGRRNLEAEGIGQLEAVIKGDVQGWNLDPEEYKRVARVGYAAERLRLLYVAITRAKQELHVTWNSGRNGDLHEAVPLSELIGWWEEECRNVAAA